MSIKISPKTRSPTSFGAVPLLVASVTIAALECNLYRATLFFLWFATDPWAWSKIAAMLSCRFPKASALGGIVKEKIVVLVDQLQPCWSTMFRFVGLYGRVIYFDPPIIYLILSEYCICSNTRQAWGKGERNILVDWAVCLRVTYLTNNDTKTKLSVEILRIRNSCLVWSDRVEGKHVKIMFREAYSGHNECPCSTGRCYISGLNKIKASDLPWHIGVSLWGNAYCIRGELGIKSW